MADRLALDEIEITPEMIEAGVEALSEFYMPVRERESMADQNAVASVFSAMIRERECRLRA